MSDKIIETLTWEGIEIEASYEPDWLGCNAKYGHNNAHLEIRSKGNATLPVTETGYRSYFLAPGLVEAIGGPTKFVIHWLNEEAQGKEWKRQQINGEQLSLF